MNFIEQLRQDHVDGTLTEKILAVANPAPNADCIEAEILRLNRMIETELDGDRLTEMCAAFRALNWARSPEAFAPPSEGYQFTLQQGQVT